MNITSWVLKSLIRRKRSTTLLWSIFFGMVMCLTIRFRKISSLEASSLFFNFSVNYSGCRFFEDSDPIVCVTVRSLQRVRCRIISMKPLNIKCKLYQGVTEEYNLKLLWAFRYHTLQKLSVVSYMPILLSETSFHEPANVFLPPIEFMMACVSRSSPLCDRRALENVWRYFKYRAFLINAHL